MTETVTEADARTAINQYDHLRLELPFVGEGEFTVDDRGPAAPEGPGSYLATLTYTGGYVPSLEAGDQVRVLHSRHGVIASVAGVSVEVVDIQADRVTGAAGPAGVWNAADAAAERVE